MNWKQEALRKLRGYAAGKRALQSLPRQIQEVRLRREGIRGARVDGLAVSGGGNGRETMLVSSLDYEAALEQRLEATRLFVEGIEDAMGCLNREEKLVLDRFYIHPETGGVERVMEDLNLERSAAYRLKDRALRRFTMAMYGWEEVLP